MDLSAPLGRAKGIGPRRSETLAAAGLLTFEDLLLTLPLRYEDRSRFLAIRDLRHGVRASVSGRILSARLRRTRVRGFTIFEIIVQDGSGALSGVWFNQPYLRRVLREGRDIVLFGEALPPLRAGKGPQLRNPHFEILGDDPERIHSGRIVPVYRRIGDLSPRRLRGILHSLLKSLPADLPDPLPGDLACRLDLLPRGRALREIHFPPPGADGDLLNRGLSPAHRRLAFEELFLLQIAFCRARREKQSRRGVPCPLTSPIRQVMNRILPFCLTEAQEKALAEIAADMSGPRPMSRLLQGEVGCGKTAVALLSALIAIENGTQAALMAPTEILAEQHFRTLGGILEGSRYRLKLLSGASRGSERKGILQALASGGIDLVVGTHALIQEPVSFRNLGLVIVDEQHRFGVQQRSLLREKGEEPHCLIMTATPIPRSLTLALYGDLDISIIESLPPGRTQVRTVLRSPDERPRIYEFIRGEADQGHRVAIVYPQVHGSEKHGLPSAVAESERLSRGPFRGLGVGLLHGQMTPQETRRALEDFRAGRIRILVATTVLEVGIDVPEASVILVEHADRFGLSQLHQLRGRVGRGSVESWCILIPGESASPQGKARLRILTETNDGFAIARRDLELRGPGELGGMRQSGDPEFKVANLLRDQDLLELAREEANRTSSPFGGPADPGLTSSGSQHPAARIAWS